MSSEPITLLSILLGLAQIVYYILPALITVFIVLSVGNQFLIEIYGLRPPANGWKHVLSMMFGVVLSRVFVRQGKIDHDPANAAAETIGGPARLAVSDNSAVVLERGGGFSRVVGPGITLLLPHERVRGAVDLRTQHRTVTEKTLTKDGLPVQVDVEMGFRITERDLPGDAPPRQPPLGLGTLLKRALGLRVPPALLEASRPHHFSREAVRRAVYETAVLSPKFEPDWTNSFAGVRAGDISDQLAELRFDEVNAPEHPDQHPLRDIVATGLQDARSAAAPMGIDVIDMSMSVITLRDDFKDNVTEQLINNWRAAWEGKATVLDAQGKAKRLQLLEEARAEAQANMIQALTEGFRIATGDSDNPNISHEVIALRFIDTLEALLQKPLEKSDEKPDRQAKDGSASDLPALLRTFFG